MVNLKEYERNNILIIEIYGELDSGSVPEFSVKFKQIREKSLLKKIILDLSSLSFISSAGWSFIIEEAKKIKKSGGDMKIASMNEAVKRVYNLVGIEVLLKSFDNLDDAIKDYEK